MGLAKHFHYSEIGDLVIKWDIFVLCAQLQAFSVGVTRETSTYRPALSGEATNVFSIDCPQNYFPMGF